VCRDDALQLAAEELSRLKPGEESHAFLVVEHLAELTQALEKLFDDVFDAQRNGPE
jgi:hypothetical protein